MTVEYFKNELALLSATAKTKCLRKAVGCSLHKYHTELGWQVVVRAMNGPSGGAHQCANIVGGCGCSHAEPRAIMDAFSKCIHDPLVMVCLYSPCTNCANIIIDSGLVMGVIYETLTEHDQRGAIYLAVEMDIIQVGCLESRSGTIGQWRTRAGYLRTSGPAIR